MIDGVPKVAIMFRTLALTGLLVAGLAVPGSAADRQGNYILRGVGIKSCSEYLEAEKTSPEAVEPYVWWIEGYLSGLNRFQSDTADGSPIVDTGIIAILTRNICRGDSSLRMETALARLMEFFKPYRIRKVEKPVTVQGPDRPLLVFSETLQWIQESLAAQGLYNGPKNGKYGDSMRQALAAYQEQRGLPVNGLPDEQTLLAMVREFQP